MMCSITNVSVKKSAFLCCFSILSLTIFSQNSKLYKLSLSDFRNYKEFQKPIDPQKFEAELLEAAVFYTTNEVRKEKKKTVLNYNELLAKAARMHSDDMVKYNFFDHINTHNKKHKEPHDRAKVAGIKNPFIAENIIEGFILNYNGEKKVLIPQPGIFIDMKTHDTLTPRTYLELADELLKRWMDSPGHRENILSKDALELGCGVSIFRMKDFNNMPVVKVTQNFQQFETVKAE